MTDQLPAEWTDLLLRLASKARTLGPYPGVLEVSILIVDGHPRFWAAPIVRPLEPKRSDTRALSELPDQDSA